jgi:hypothetical protein
VVLAVLLVLEKQVVLAAVAVMPVLAMVGLETRLLQPRVKATMVALQAQPMMVVAAAAGLLLLVNQLPL